MIEMFEHWLLKKNPSWSDIIQLLNRVGEEELAKEISAYTSEMERLESKTGRLTERRLVPTKGSSFEDRIIRNAYYENETLARKSIDKLQEFNEIIACLLDVRHKWYEIGIALGVPKAKLDEIDLFNSERRTVDSKMRLMLQHAQENLAYKFTWKRLIDALINLDFNSCVESVENIAPNHTTCTSLYRLDVYRKQDFVSRRTELTKDRRFIKKVKRIRIILELDPTITDEQVLGNLFQHTLSNKADLFREERIMEEIKVIQELSVEYALEGEQQADDVIEDIHYQACYEQRKRDYWKRRQDKIHLSSAINGLNRCISSIVRSKQTLQQAINYIKATKPHHKDSLEQMMKGVNVGGIAGVAAGVLSGAAAGSAAGAVVLSIPFGIAGAIAGGFLGAATGSVKSPEEYIYEQHIKKLEEFQISIDKDMTIVNEVMERLQGKRDFIQRSYQ